MTTMHARAVSLALGLSLVAVFGPQAPGAAAQVEASGRSRPTPEVQPSLVAQPAQATQPPQAAQAPPGPATAAGAPTSPGDTQAPPNTQPASSSPTTSPAQRLAPAQARVDTEPPSEGNPLAFEFVPVTPESQGGLTAHGIASRIVEVSPDTRRANAEAAFAQQRSDRAFSLFVPRVELVARYTRLSPVRQFKVPAALEDAMPGAGDAFRKAFPILLNNYLLQASVRIPISDYFLTLNEHYTSAKRLAAFQELQRKGEWQAATYQVRKDYYGLAGAVAARNLALHRIEQLRKFVGEVRILVDGGEMSSVQLAQARVRLASAEADAQRALADQRIAEQTLRSRLALPPGAPVAIGESLTDRVPTPPQDLQGLMQAAHDQRPESLALRELYAARTATRDATAMERWPSLSLFGDVTYSNPNMRYNPPSNEFNATWAVGVELSWSPTDLAIQQTNLDEAHLEVARVVEDMRTLHGRIDIEVTGAYENALAAHSALATARTAVDAADETYRVQRALFFAGESTSRVALDAELELRRAQLQWVGAVLDTHLAHDAIAHATGQMPRD